MAQFQQSGAVCGSSRPGGQRLKTCSKRAVFGSQQTWRTLPSSHGPAGACVAGVQRPAQRADSVRSRAASADKQSLEADMQHLENIETVDYAGDPHGKLLSRTLSPAELLAAQLPGKNTRGERIQWGKDTRLRNQVQLTTYPDAIGGSMSTLHSFVRKHLQGVIGGVHILPFYPSSADRGFAPLTYQAVDENFGTWEDIEGISARHDLCVDFMVNHISAQSKQFKDFQEKGDESEWADLFIRYDKFWGGEPSQEDLDRIYTRKPRAPFREVEHADGSVQKVWCTFDTEQVDIDVFSEKGKQFIKDELTALCDRGADLIRLDAFGYTTKKKGTNCFFVEPEVWELLDRVEGLLADQGTELLCEVHEHYSMQKRLAEKGFWVYDFALPMLCLQALYDGDANNLKAWLLKCPRNQITTLDTHDGIGVVDVADLMTEEQSERTRCNIFEHGANANMRYNSAEYGNLDIYQINCTYYSALGNRDDWYLLARAIQLFTPGIPLIYYVGLFAGENDLELVESTKVGRDINRHPYDLDEAINEVKRPVVKALFELCRFRNSHPAFSGTFELLDTLADIQDAVVLMPPAMEGEADPTSVSMDSAERTITDAAGRSYEAYRPAENGNEEVQYLETVVGVEGAEEVLGSSREGASTQTQNQTEWPVDKALESSYEALRKGESSMKGEASMTAGNGNGGIGGSQGDEGATNGNEVDEPATNPLELSADSIIAALEERGFGSGHSDAENMLLDTQQRMFRPYSAALANCRDKSCMKSPAELLVKAKKMNALQQVRAIRTSQIRDPKRDLPRGVLCCKWTNGDSWAVLEANVETKEFRILYVDPFDGRQKVWAVTETLEAHGAELHG